MVIAQGSMERWGLKKEGTWHRSGPQMGPFGKVKPQAPKNGGRSMKGIATVQSWRTHGGGSRPEAVPCLNIDPGHPSQRHMVHD
jgi:hypothetical protein